MVVQKNIETELDLANGAHRTIVGIVLDPNEPSIDANKNTMHLEHLPKYIMVKLEHTCISQLQDLEDSIIPIEPRKQNLQIHIPQQKGEPVQWNVTCLQIPITLAYDFTDYC